MVLAVAVTPFQALHGPDLVYDDDARTRGLLSWRESTTLNIYECTRSTGSLCAMSGHQSSWAYMSRFGRLQWR